MVLALCMSCSVYHTEWESLAYKLSMVGSNGFDLSASATVGSWGFNVASQIDGIVNTAARLLSFIRHSESPNCLAIPSDINQRIERGVVSLSSQLATWNVSSTSHVGFEIVIPALIGYLQQEDAALSFAFDSMETLTRIRATKLLHLNPRLLYEPATDEGGRRKSSVATAVPLLVSTSYVVQRAAASCAGQRGIYELHSGRKCSLFRYRRVQV